MKVELVLNDDVELKAYIKELIKNEIINISRTEISETVKDTLDKKVENIYNTRFTDLLIEREISKQVAVKLNGYWKNNDLNKYIDNRIKLSLDDYFKRLGLQVISEIDKNENAMEKSRR